MKNVSLLIFLIVVMNSIAAAKASEISLLAYNVENLFDTEHDEGKNDWEYLPLSHPLKKKGCETIESTRYRESCLKKDWNKTVYLKKLNAVAEIIRKSVGENQELPDVVGLVEVENANVVADLAKELGYKNHYTANGPDKRGIDVAVMYNDKFKVKKIREIGLKGKYFKTKPTRTILELTFDLGDKELLTVSVNHWPSQANPAETRMIAAKETKKSLFWKRVLNKKHHYVSLGDFNVIDSDDPHPFRNNFSKGINKLFDLKDLYQDSESITDEQKEAMPLGTYFYAPKMTWNYLDRIFVTKSLADKKGWDADIASFKVISNSLNAQDVKYESGYHAGTVIKAAPLRFNISDDQSTKGASDHFPIFVKLRRLN